MNKLTEIVRSPHVQIALATGACIIIMAFASKRLLPEPIAYIPLAIPALFMTFYELISTKYKNEKISTTWYWIVAIFISTVLIIIYYMI